MKAQIKPSANLGHVSTDCVLQDREEKKKERIKKISSDPLPQSTTI